MCGELASVFERVDGIDIFVAPYGFDPWKTQRKSTRMARARLNRIERDLEYDVRFYLTITAMIELYFV